MGFWNWISANIIQGMSLIVDKDLTQDLIFTLGCWWMWRWKNEAVFGDGYNCQEHAFFIISQARQCMYAWLVDQREVFPKKERFIGWTCPKGRWVKVNTNGTFKGNLGLAGGGGVIQQGVGLQDLL